MPLPAQIALYLLGPILVGLFTLLGSSWATKKAHQLDQQRRSEERQQYANQLLRALRAELAVGRDRYMEAIGRKVEKLAKDEPVPGVFYAMQNYFSVYEGAGQSLGMVGDAQTVDKIVRAYTYMRALLESYAIHNDQTDRFHKLKNKGLAEAANAREQLSDQRRIIQETQNQALAAVDEAQQAIQQYLGEAYGTIE